VNKKESWRVIEREGERRREVEKGRGKERKREGGSCNILSIQAIATK
jgi:hypothetical protein